MPELSDWSFPIPLQPQEGEVSFDLDRVLNGVVRLMAKIPDDAFTASILGTERAGNGAACNGPRGNTSPNPVAKS